MSENGGTPYNVVRGTQSNGNWAFRPNGPNGNAVFPLTITLRDLFANSVTCTFTALQPGVIGNCAGNFPDPPANFAGASSSCSRCTQPYMNNGQSKIWDGSMTPSMWPQQVGQWLPVTSSPWASYALTYTRQTAVVYPGGSGAPARVPMNQW